MVDAAKTLPIALGIMKLSVDYRHALNNCNGSIEFVKPFGDVGVTSTSLVFILMVSGDNDLPTVRLAILFWLRMKELCIRIWAVGINKFQAFASTGDNVKRTMVNGK